MAASVLPARDADFSCLFLTPPGLLQVRAGSSELRPPPPTLPAPHPPSLAVWGDADNLFTDIPPLPSKPLFALPALKESVQRWGPQEPQTPLDLLQSRQVTPALPLWRSQPQAEAVQQGVSSCGKRWDESL